MIRIIFAMSNPETDCAEVSTDEQIHIYFSCQKYNVTPVIVAGIHETNNVLIISCIELPPFDHLATYFLHQKYSYDTVNISFARHLKHLYLFDTL